MPRNLLSAGFGERGSLTVSAFALARKALLRAFLRGRVWRQRNRMKHPWLQAELAVAFQHRPLHLHTAAIGHCRSLVLTGLTPTSVLAGSVLSPGSAFQAPACLI